MVDPSSEFVRQFPPAAYRRLSNFRFAIRKYLHFSEQAARESGFEPQQYQLLLTVKGLPENVPPTITALSDRLCLRHHSTVELVNRMVNRGMIERRSSDEDRRQALIALTADGEQALEQLCILHWQEMQKLAPALISSLREIV